MRQRVEALEKTLPTLSSEDQKVVDHFHEATAFETERVQASKHADRVMTEVDAVASTLLMKRDLDGDVMDEATNVSARYGDLVDALESGLRSLHGDLAVRRAALADAEQAWAKRLEEARAARDGVLKKLGAHKTATAQIVKLREEGTKIADEIGDLETGAQSGWRPVGPTQRDNWQTAGS